MEKFGCTAKSWLGSLYASRTRTTCSAIPETASSTGWNESNRKCQWIHIIISTHANGNVKCLLKNQNCLFFRPFSHQLYSATVIICMKRMNLEITSVIRSFYDFIKTHKGNYQICYASEECQSLVYIWMEWFLVLQNYYNECLDWNHLSNYERKYIVFRHASEESVWRVSFNSQSLYNPKRELFQNGKCGKWHWNGVDSYKAKYRANQRLQ